VTDAAGRVFRKSQPNPPAGFFAAEARGLQWLATVEDGPPLPDVLAVDEHSITLTHIETGPSSASAAEDFGRALAAMHRAGASAYGAGWPGYIGTIPLDNTHNAANESWAQWYAERRVLPYVQLARDRGALAGGDVRALESACARLPNSDEPPARIHGDLWSGNVLWGADGRVWLIDPAAHGGHRETDLAMLALFGEPYLDHIVAAYDEADPLADGWRDRVGVHQLHPLLVHAVLFGGAYGPRAAAIAAHL
jgi:fructosamine-3-kinase